MNHKGEDINMKILLMSFYIFFLKGVEICLSYLLWFTYYQPAKNENLFFFSFFAKVFEILTSNSVQFSDIIFALVTFQSRNELSRKVFEYMCL